MNHNPISLFVLKLTLVISVILKHDAFYAQHNLSTRSFVLSGSKRIVLSQPNIE